MSFMACPLKTDYVQARQVMLMHSFHTVEFDPFTESQLALRNQLLPLPSSSDSLMSFMAC